MSDIEWNIEKVLWMENKDYGDISYVNNTKYDILDLDITYSRKSGITDEQMLDTFSVAV